MSINVKLTVNEQINFAIAGIKKSSIVKSVQISGCKDQTVILKISAAPAFIYEYRREITPNSDTYRNTRILLDINDEYYRTNVLEGRDAAINVEIYDAEHPDKLLASAQEAVRLQPYLQWNRMTDPISLVSFMQPSEPLVAKVLSRAGELANAEQGMMVSYFDFKGCAPIQQAEWIYNALCEEKLHYYLPPAGFEDSPGQKIRIPAMVLNENCKQGTCIDLAVLYATCLEAASLHPVIFLVQGHAFAGLWLDEKASFNNCKCEDLKTVEDNLRYNVNKNGAFTERADRSLVAVECTLFPDDRQIPFSTALSAGLNNIKTMKFCYAIDVDFSRRCGYTPAFTFTNNPICDPTLTPVMQPANVNISKLERLQKQAMDISLKNRLLNLDNAKEKQSFDISAEGFFKGEYSGEKLFAGFMTAESKSSARKAETDKKLYYIMKADAESKQKNGCASSFLGINLLRWIPKSENAEEPVVLEAPLYICPVELYRNIRGEIVFKASGSTFVNPALKQLLRSDYNLDISPVLNVPGDEYAQQVELLNSILEIKDGWKLVTDKACIFNCNMPNEAIYYGLKNESLTNHDIVAGILEGAMTWNNVCDENAEDAPEKTVYAFAADNSQRKIIRTMEKKRALAVMGPAGNGKSQTIANVITEHMAKGKKVLFVADKPTARAVVFDKLKEIGMDTFCLKIDGGEQRIGDIKDKLESTLKYISGYKASKKNGGLTDYENAVGKFGEYYKKLTAQGESGKSLMELYEENEKYRNVPGILDLDSVKSKINAEGVEKTVSDYAELIKNGGPGNITVLSHVRNTGNTDAEILNARASVNRLDFAYEAFAAKTRLLGKELNCSEGADAEQLLRYAKVLERCPAVGGSLEEFDTETLYQIISLSKEKARFPEGSEVNKAAAKKLQELLAKADGKSGSADSSQTYSSFNIVGGVRPGMPNGGFSKEEIEYLKNIKKFRQYENKVIEISAVRPEAEQTALLKLIRKLARKEAPEVRKNVAEIIEAYYNYENALNAAAENLLRDYGGQDIRELLREWNTIASDTQKYKDLVNVIAAAEKQGVLPVIYQLNDKLAKGEITAEQLVPLFIKSRNKLNIDTIVSSTPEISEYGKLRYPYSVNQLRLGETPARETYRTLLKETIIAQMPNISEGVSNNPGLGAIQHIVRNGNAVNNIRNLFEKGGSALTQLYPCMIMSPEAVAECVPFDYPRYDLVIFDESSQLQTYKALIPIAHAEKCMIVGDEKQLVPTSFFRKAETDENGQNIASEAILEDAIATSMPQLMLQYHYRSKYESLVAFSNAKYYNGEMISFPNTDTEFMGVEYVFVEDGVYDRSGKRTNEAEAKKVVELLNEIYEQLPENTAETVGVITFNLEQMKLIQEMVRLAVKDKAGHYKQLDGLVDVVNLESCQGREWDTTILSLTYGRDSDGELSGNFGPMMRDEGRNRLNVMITRARKQMYVVTSLNTEDFKDNVRAGVADIRDFIAYAKGELKLDSRKIGEASESKTSDMCENVAEMLREKGHTVHTNIGSSACKVDIGIVSETEKTKYKLGILLDDFDGSFDAYDRETVITNMLESKGWKLYRLHSADWNRDYVHEISKIEEMLM